jgi:hypothetical protein
LVSKARRTRRGGRRVSGRASTFSRAWLALAVSAASSAVAVRVRTTRDAVVVPARCQLLRVESPVYVSGQLEVATTIAAVWPAAGWSYAVRKAGGYDQAVEVDFASTSCAARFRALYKPGKTTIDGGRLNCR